MAKFKVGDIVRLKDSKYKNVFYRIIKSSNFIIGDDNSEKVLKCEILGRIGFTFFMESAVQKVTFYEMLDFLLYQKPRFNLIIKITEDELNLIYELLKKASLVLIEHLWRELLSDNTIMFYVKNGFHGYGEVNINFNFDNLDFEKDLKEIEIKEKINKTLDVVEGKLEDAYMRSIVYGEEITVGEFLNKCCNSYFNLINNNDKKVGINMTSEQVANKIKDIVKQLYKKEPEDEVFVNNKNKTTVIKWADGELTKATCEKEDKYDLEKGVMVAMLKKHYTVDEINSFIEKAKKSQERDLNKYRKKSNKEVKKTLMDNTGEKPTNPNIGVKIKKKKEE